MLISHLHRLASELLRELHIWLEAHVVLHSHLIELLLLILLEFDVVILGFLDVLILARQILERIRAGKQPTSYSSHCVFFLVLEQSHHIRLRLPIRRHLLYLRIVFWLWLFKFLILSDLRLSFLHHLA